MSHKERLPTTGDQANGLIHRGMDLDYDRS